MVLYLLAKGADHMHPIVLYWVIAEDGLGETSRHVDQVVEGHRGDTALSNGNVGP